MRGGETIAKSKPTRYAQYPGVDLYLKWKKLQGGTELLYNIIFIMMTLAKMKTLYPKIPNHCNSKPILR